MEERQCRILEFKLKNQSINLNISEMAKSTQNDKLAKFNNGYAYSLISSVTVQHTVA